MPRSKTSRPLASYADKPPTAVQLHFANWIEEMTGYKVDEQSVALAKALHSEWQASPERQEMLDQRRKEREAALARRQRGRPGRRPVEEPEEPEPSRKAVREYEPDAFGADEEQEEPAPRRRRAASTRRRAPKAAAPEPELDDELPGSEEDELEDEEPRASALAGPAPRRRAQPY